MWWIKSQKEDQHIILETTGSYIPAWLLNEKSLNKKYTIVFSYSLVNLDNLIKKVYGEQPDDEIHRTIMVNVPTVLGMNKSKKELTWHQWRNITEKML